MAKLLKLRRGTTTQHASFTGAEGEVTIDTTKDTAVVHDGAQAGGRPLAREDMSNVSSASIAGQLGTDSIATTKIAAGALPTDVTVSRGNIVDGEVTSSELDSNAVTNSKINNGAVTNDKVSASAAIAGTKISPNFGSQNVVTTGTLGSGDLTITSAEPKLSLTDSDHNSDFILLNSHGNFRIFDETNTAERFKIASNGQTTISGNTDFGAGIDVTGDITASGDGTFNGGDVTISSTAPRLILTDTNNNSDFRIAVESGNFLIEDTTNSNADRFVIDSNGTASIAGNLDCSSGVDVTGNITVTGTVDGRDVAADGTKLDGIESGATADQTAAEILTAIKTVDGSGSGLDADTLHGMQPNTGNSTNSIVQRTASGYIFANYFNTTANDVSSGVTKIMCETGNDNYIRHADAGAVRSFINVENGATADQTKSDIDALNINADTVDGQHMTSSSDVSLGSLDLNNGVSHSGAGAIYGRNYAYDTVELSGHGAEFMMGARSTDIHINYRMCNNNTTNHTPTDWYWRQGSSNSWAHFNVGNLNANGNIVATGNVTAYSDARLKTNVNTINEALGIVGKLRGVSFDWKESGKHSIGVIAQEVEAVLPELVETIEENIGTKEEPNYREVKTVDYGKIVGVLINAINELKAEVDELKGGK